MNKLLTLELEGLPPSVNAMYRTGKGAQRYKKAEVSEWQDEVARVMRQAWNNPPSIHRRSRSTCVVHGWEPHTLGRG